MSSTSSNSSSLESFVNSIRNLYQSKQQSGAATSTSLVNLNEIYSTLSSNLDVLNEQSALNLIDNVLPLFPLPEFTLPNLFILFSATNKIQQVLKNTETVSDLAGVDSDRLLIHLESAIQLADENQIELAVEVYSELCHFYTNRLCSLNKPRRGLAILQVAVRKIQYDANNSGQLRLNQLTMVHSDLLQLSLASKNLTPALELLSHEILDLNKPQSSSFDARYLLSFFYYAGCVHAAMKQFDQALFYFEQAVSVPATALSQIMIDSYKKLVIVSLLSKGCIVSLPKYSSRLVSSQIKPICKVYHDLAKSYVNYNQEEFNSICARYTELFVADKNMGLIRQLQLSLYKRNVQKLTKTFITLSLNDMATKLKLESAREAEQLMLNMIKDGEIFACINQKDGMVSFQDNPEKYDNQIVSELLTKEMLSCIEMDAQIKTMDREITTHPQYIQKIQTSGAGGSGPAGAGSVKWASIATTGLDDDIDPMFAQTTSVSPTRPLAR